MFPSVQAGLAAFALIQGSFATDLDGGLDLYIRGEAGGHNDGLAELSFEARSSFDDLLEDDDFLDLFHRDSVRPVKGLESTKEDIATLCQKDKPEVKDFVTFFQTTGKKASNLLFWSGLEYTKVEEFAKKKGYVTLQSMIRPYGEDSKAPTLPGCERFTWPEDKWWFTLAAQAFIQFAATVDAPVHLILGETRHRLITHGTIEEHWPVKENIPVWLATEVPALAKKFGVKDSSGWSKVKMYIADDDLNDAKEKGNYDGPVTGVAGSGATGSSSPPRSRAAGPISRRDLLARPVMEIGA